MNPTKRVRLGGLLIAVSGFGITRLFVAETVRVDMPVLFILAGLLPLIVGLVLTAYGVALAVGPFGAEYVNTVARWHLLGVGGMAIVFAITGLDQFVRTGTVAVGSESPLLVANVLLGGAVGGTLTGIHAGTSRRQQREISRSANRALLVNRLLKHEVLNAITIIDGHADLLSDGDGDRPESMSAIRRAVERIRSTIRDVGTVARDRGGGAGVDLERIVREEVAAAGDAHDAAVDLAVHTADASSTADERIAIVVRELLENAAMYGGDRGVSVSLDEASGAVELSVTDDGPGLPERQRALLEEGQFPEYDDPAAGFGLQIVRLLVTQFGGRIRVEDAAEGGTRITVVLPRNDETAVNAATIGLSFPNLTGAVVGGVLGGVAMGVVFQASTGLLPVIGSLYGIGSPLVGWVTHLFHSAVFGLLFAAVTAAAPVARVASGTVRCAVLGLVWGVVLWLVAAGVVMPLWLSLVGVPASLPNLSLVGLVGHAVWGVVLGVAYDRLIEMALVERLGRRARVR
ncbi:sensor histidine kinase [Halobellus rubicundus]|uniref:Sensor histidine kinase n=1 Tax=Halobellus rubicundus TaxID=2996466 RepID=A0ABD5M899_9EURY